jgi:hypothetical protein
MKYSLAVSGLVVAILSTSTLSRKARPQTVNPVIGTWKQNMGEVRLQSQDLLLPRGWESSGSTRPVQMDLSLPSLSISAQRDFHRWAPYPRPIMTAKSMRQHTVATLATSLGSHLAPKIERTISYTPVNLYTGSNCAAARMAQLFHAIRALSRGMERR